MFKPTLRARITSIFVLLGIFAACLTGLLGYRAASASLEDATFARLTAIREAKKRQIESYFRGLRHELSAIAGSEGLARAAAELAEGFRRFPAAGAPRAAIAEAENALREFYTQGFYTRLNAFPNNTRPLESYWPESARTRLLQAISLAEPRQRFDAATLERWAGGTAYGQARERHDALLGTVARAFDFPDVYLVDAETGDVIYSSGQGVELATSLEDGPYRDSGLAEVFRAARRMASPGGVELSDFAPYAPIHHAPAAFLAAPVFAGARRIAVLAARLPIAPLNQLMTAEGRWQAEGLGATGEAYLVGADLQLRSDARLLLEDRSRYLELLREAGAGEESLALIRAHDTSALYHRMDTEAARQALAGKPGSGIAPGYQGSEVLSSWTPVWIDGVRLGLVAEIATEEAFAPVVALGRRILLIALLISGAFAGLGLLSARSITGPLAKVIAGTRRIGSGDFTRRLEVTGSGEIRTLAESINQMADSLQHTTVSRDYFDNILSSMTNAVIVVADVVDNHRTMQVGATITMVNRAACEMLGYAKEELEGAPVRDIVWDGPGHSLGWFRDLLRDGYLRGVEKRWVRKDGAHIPVLFAGSVLRDKAGAVLGVLCIAQDISELKQAQQAIETNEQRLRRQNQALTELTRSEQLGSGELDAFLCQLTRIAGETLDIDRSSIWVYEDGESSIRSLNLYERVLCCHSMGARLSAADYPKYFQSLREDRVIAADDAHHDPRTAEFSENYLKPLGISSMLDAPVRVSGRMIGVLCNEHVGPPRHWTLDEQQFASGLADMVALAMEVHQRKRAEQQLEEYSRTLEVKVEERTRALNEKHAQLVQSEKMAALGNLVAGVAHEINTPLGALKSNNEVALRAVERIRSLLMQSEGALSGKALDRTHDLLETMQRLGRVSQEAAERISRIVATLKNFARLDRASFDEVDLHEGLESTLTLVHHELKNRIQVEKEYGELPRIPCYPNQINQVFMNILVNAAQAIHREGAIRIRTYSQDSHAVVEISDTGHGIPRENLTRIFDPGFTTKGVGVGTGLGLSIVHRIIQDHDGRIEVESEVGRGSTFRIFLPLTAEALAEREREHHRASRPA